jgi:hypothetical protein
MNTRRTIAWIFVFIGVAFLALKLSHTYDPVPTITRWSVKAGPRIAHFVKTSSPEMVVYIVLVGLPIAIGGLLLAGASSAAGSPSAESRTAVAKSVEPHEIPAFNRGKRAQGARTVHSANVLQVAPQARHIWQFDARNGGFSLNREQTTLNGESLPSGLVGKDWRSLWQKKLNIAWLPPEHVFLRVAQFPASEFQETLSMVELQLEKLSPIPVAQIVWSIHVLPHTSGNMQTVIVIIAARSQVEEFLGQLEGQGYLADALELPILDQLQATPVREDGVWIYPESTGGPQSALAAWWYGGVLQNLDLLTIASTDRSTGLREQLTQMAWAGELEGWLSAPPSFHLVASGAAAQEWEPLLRQGLEQPVEVTEPLPAPRLAAATARRAAFNPPNANLLPAEFTTRYQQQFVDRLWMRSLFAIAGIYTAGVTIYLIALGFANYRTGGVEQQIADLGRSYTNALQLDKKLSILKERQELKFAGLDCYRAVAELMPETLTLENCNFSDGRRLTLNGTAPPDEVQKLYTFESDLRKYTLPSGQPLFDPFKTEVPTIRKINEGTLNWSMGLELKRSETR